SCLPPPSIFHPPSSILYPLSPTPMSPRLQHLAHVRSLVVKLGTQLLSDKDRRLDAAFLSTIAAQVAALRAKGVKITIVSSGAVGAALAELQPPNRPTDLAKLQAV